MILLITGTPGTGKSSLAEALAEREGGICIHLNDLVPPPPSPSFDPTRGSRRVDLKDLVPRVRARIGRGLTIIEGHFSHLLPLGDAVIVLRTHPEVLRRRLEERGYREAKIRENLEAEALDVCLCEAIQRHSRVWEIETTDASLEETLQKASRILRGEGEEYLPGKIDWSESFFFGET
jgi:adenylate kinase